ncbi:MAG: aldo/keto reductase [Chloroflexi bacterium]|nr:aldo/keto reductase [Chloroflexota bacterium]
MNNNRLGAIRMVHAYIDRGGNHLDTANVYAGGRRDQVTLATKVRFGATPEDDLGAGLSRRVIMEQVEGKVRYIGVSNFRAWQVMQALGLSDANGWARFIAGQYQYSLAVRDIEYEFSSLFAADRAGLAAGPTGGQQRDHRRAHAGAVRGQYGCRRNRPHPGGAGPPRYRQRPPGDVPLPHDARLRPGVAAYSPSDRSRRAETFHVWLPDVKRAKGISRAGNRM